MASIYIFFNLFSSLAKSQQYDQDGLIDIFKQYGDHLYGKGDHDGAIDQYIKTIGKLEASYVIRKVILQGDLSLIFFWEGGITCNLTDLPKLCLPIHSLISREFVLLFSTFLGVCLLLS
jgi:hypothetical protein